MFVKVLHRHAADVSEFLKKFMGAWRRLSGFDQGKNSVYLVDDLTGNETAHVCLDVLHECHIEHAYSSFYGRKDVAMTSQGMGASFGFATREKGLDFFVDDCMAFFELNETPGQVFSGCFVELFADLKQ